MRGRDIKRYSYDWAGLWLIWIPWHFPLHLDSSIQGSSAEAEQAFMDQYPSVYQHLLLYKPQLSARNKAETCIRYEWYALQRWDANYSDDFSQPKIVWIELTDESKFALSTDGLIPLNTVFFMVGKHIKYLLAVINSSLIHWYFQNTLGSTSGVGTNRWLKYTVECIPVPLIQDDAEWESLVDDIQKYKRDSKDSAVLENIIDNKVFDLYGLSEDERAFTLNSHTKR